jgi:hypothetical protein
MNMFMFLDRGRTGHQAVGEPSNLPAGTDTMCVQSGISGAGFQSISPSVIVSGRASDAGPTLCVKWTLLKSFS